MTVAPIPGWTIASTGPLGATVLLRSVHTSTGRSIVVAEFPAATTALHLHVGSGDPPGAAAAAPLDAGPAVSTSEAALLVAAFNGAFKRDAGAGGVEVDGSVVSPLLSHEASVVINQDGTVDVGTWGSQVPTPGEQVVDVRQNLALLVDGGLATPASSSSADAVWGATVAGGPGIARSAIGVDRAGDVLYAAAMSALPTDLAQAMVAAGAVRAMQLDINPFWVTFGAASQPGGPLLAQVPGEDHSPSIFSSGWQRDFFTVLARPSLNCRLVFPAPGGVATAEPPLTRCAPLHEQLAPSSA